MLFPTSFASSVFLFLFSSYNCFTVQNELNANEDVGITVDATSGDTEIHVNVDSTTTDQDIDLSSTQSIELDVNQTDNGIIESNVDGNVISETGGSGDNVITNDGATDNVIIDNGATDNVNREETTTDNVGREETTATAQTDNEQDSQSEPIQQGLQITDDNDPRLTTLAPMTTEISVQNSLLNALRRQGLAYDQSPSNATQTSIWSSFQKSFDSTRKQFDSSLRNYSRYIEDNVDKSIRKAQAVLKEQAEHFVGKLNVWGRQIYDGIKEGKLEMPKYPKLIVWNGIVKMLPGLDPNVPPAKMTLHPDIGNMPKYGPTCIKSGKQYNNTVVSRGPKADGLSGLDFEPCLNRKRGEKSLRLTSDANGDEDTLVEEPTTEEENGEQEGGQQENENQTRQRQKRSETYSSIAMLWKDPRRIVFKFHDSFPKQFQVNVRSAIRFWEDSTCLRFLESNTSKISEAYILFTTGGGSCSTNRLGPNPYPPYSTIIDASICFNSTGSLAHEIGHAMGMSHSQKRVDRDQSIKIYIENIAQSWQNQFDRDSSQHFTDWGIPYYFDSIMHYFPYAASKNGLMTICPFDPLMEVVMGQREEPAFGDIALMNRIYCQESCFLKSQLKQLQFSGNKSTTISGRFCQKWSTQSPHKHTYGNVGNHSWCRNPDNWGGGPWCFTTDPTVKYEPCFPSCEDMTTKKKPFCHGWCYNGGYHNPRTCECVCSRFAKGNYCEELDTTAMYAHVTCGGKITLKFGQKIAIASPNYPNNYSASSVCMWWIQAPSGNRVKLTVLDFLMEIPDRTGCYDYLELRPSICASAIEPPEHMRFCGSSLKPTNSSSLKELMSDDNNFILKFYSDDGETGRGFSILAEAVIAPPKK